MKKFIAGFSAAILVVALGSTVFAALSEADGTKQAGERAIAADGERPDFSKVRGEITDEMKAEMEAKKAEMEQAKAKWDALSDAQKEEVYKLQDSAIDAQKAVIDKYAELGIISSSSADDMKAKLEEQKSLMREEDRGMFGGFGIKGGGHMEMGGPREPGDMPERPGAPFQKELDESGDV